MLLVGGSTPEPVDLRVRDGRVVEVGARLEPERGEQVVTLGGRFVRRGLRDAHAHFAEWARARRQLDLSGTRSAVQAADVVAEAVAGRSPSGLLEGGGFRDPTWPSPPTAELLDRAAPGWAVVLRSLDLHTAWLSRPALALCGLADHPTGLLREHEAWDAVDRLPRRSDAEEDAAAAEAVAAAHGRGVTEVVDFDFAGAHPAWLRRRGPAGRLGLRVTAVVPRSQAAAYADSGLVTGVGDEWLRVGPVKLFADGSLGSRTARCLHPYPGGHGSGLQLLDPEELRAALGEASASGFTVAVHAIGDEATRDVLAALAATGARGASVEHAQLLRREDLPLFRAADVTASIQPAHLVDDRELVDDLWSGTDSVPYAARSLLDAGARVVLGSDAPVSPLDPWVGIAAAVHRTEGSAPPWHGEEAITLEEALTAAGARRPRAGDPADLVVLDVDRVPEDPLGLARVPVWGVLLGGCWTGGAPEGVDHLRRGAVTGRRARRPDLDHPFG